MHLSLVVFSIYNRFTKVQPHHKSRSICVGSRQLLSNKKSQAFEATKFTS